MPRGESYRPLLPLLLPVLLLLLLPPPPPQLQPKLPVHLQLLLCSDGLCP